MLSRTKISHLKDAPPNAPIISKKDNLVVINITPENEKVFIKHHTPEKEKGTTMKAETKKATPNSPKLLSMDPMGNQLQD